jgi:hypothetical protein
MFNFYGPPMGGGNFEATYRAFPLAFIDKQSAEYGDKVIMPPSALDRLGAARGARGDARCARRAHAQRRIDAAPRRCAGGRGPHRARPPAARQLAP